MLANRARTLAITALLAALAIVLAACGAAGMGQDGQSSKSPVDNGPNAGLSNNELISRAITNMATLKSYQFDFIGVQPTNAVTPTQIFSATGYYVQMPESMKATMQYSCSDPRNCYSAMTMVSSGLLLEGRPLDVIRVGPKTFLSSDQGKTWKVLSPQDLSGVVLMPLYTGSSWQTMGEGEVEELVNAKYGDGDPKIELIDGVPTRHMVTSLQTDSDVPGQPGIIRMFNFGGEVMTPTLSLWVSTDATPIVRRMQMDASAPTRQYTTGREQPSVDKVDYSLTWTYSGFNKDFDEMKPPPTKATK